MRKLVALCTTCGDQYDVRESSPYGNEFAFVYDESWGGNMRDKTASLVEVDISIKLRPRVEIAEGYRPVAEQPDMCSDCRGVLLYRIGNKLKEDYKKHG